MLVFKALNNLLALLGPATFDRYHLIAITLRDLIGVRVFCGQGVRGRPLVIFITLGILLALLVSLVLTVVLTAVCRRLLTAIA